MKEAKLRMQLDSRGSVTSTPQFGEQERQRLAHDPHRPQYHFLPPANWMNDPNGLIQWNGEYHLFYQHNPLEPRWGPMHWGHASSHDLVHWRDHPVALAPSPGTADEGGCWSGCVVNDNGTPTLMYSGHRAGQERPCLATSEDGLRSWTKHDANPLITDLPPGLCLTNYRDPFVWREDGTWFMLSGAGIKGVGGAALLYRSYDLRTWTYMKPVLVGDQSRTHPVWSGSTWECPQLLHLDGGSVLLVSAWDAGLTHHAVYFSGNYVDHAFTPSVEGLVDTGGHFYAPQVLLDDAGRHLMWGWLWEGRDENEQLMAGWAGVLSLPRELSLEPNGTLRQRPAPELTSLRESEHYWNDFRVSPGTSKKVEGLRGDSLEVQARLQLNREGRGGLALRCSPDGTERTLIRYDATSGLLEVDRSQSSLNTACYRERRGVQLMLAEGEALELHLFLDRSVLEIFANGRSCLSSRIYPSRADSLEVAVFAEIGEIQLETLRAWRLRAIWPTVIRDDATTIIGH